MVRFDELVERLRLFSTPIWGDLARKTQIVDVRPRFDEAGKWISR